MSSRFASPFMAKSPLRKEKSKKRYDKLHEKADDLDQKSFEKDKEGGNGARLRRRAGRVRRRAGSVNNVGSALTHKTKETHIHPTEFTGKIQTKEDGQEYSLIDLEANQKVRDTLKPAGLKFNKGMVDKDGYLKGSLDLPAVKTGNKTFTLKEEGTK